jgi:ribosomal protein L11 methyltransferase
VRWRLLALVPEGFEELEEPAGLALVAYVDAAREARLRAEFPDATATPVRSGWENAWREQHRPVRAGGIWIGPPWVEPPSGAPAVIVDPGRAFGTGAHPTTRLCIEQLARLEPTSLVDIGCGSGVVSLAAARLGYGPIVAVDNDPVAIDATLATARLNGVRLEARLLDATREELPGARVAVANILLAEVERILPRLHAEAAVTSGYVRGDEPVVPGWRRLERLELDGWAADTFVRA